MPDIMNIYDDTPTAGERPLPLHPPESETAKYEAI